MGEGLYLDDIYGGDQYYEEHLMDTLNSMHNRKQEMKAQYSKNRNAETGATINCPVCGQIIVKRSYQQVFCKKKTKGKSNCKDKYWNLIKPRGYQKGDFRA